MTQKTTQKKAQFSDAFGIVAIVSLIVVGLATFEHMTGIPTSMRGTAIYNVLPMPSSEALKNAAPEEARIPATSDLTKQRVCDRISRSFGSNSGMLKRVNDRIFHTLGFRCGS